MPLNKTHYRVSVSDTDKGKEYWASRAEFDPVTKSNIRSADVIVLPWDNRANGGFSFPTGTTIFYQELSKSLNSKELAIAIDVDSYRELALHADELRWPDILVTGLLFPVIIVLLTKAVDKVTADPSPPNSIEMNVTIEGENGHCISIEYKGPPSRLADTLVKEAERCLPLASSPDEKMGNGSVVGIAKKGR